MKVLIPAIALILIINCMGCASKFHVGKNCNYAYREVNDELEKTELSVCEEP